LKLSNEYSRQLGRLYALAPKSVVAAVAVSMLTCGGDRLDSATPEFLAEWQILHENGIVQQPVPARFREQAIAAVKTRLGK
jgi:hypothetical protein